MKSTDSAANNTVSGKKKSAIVKPVPKSKLTCFYEARKTTVYSFAEKIRITFFSDSWAATIMWSLIVLICLGILAWFFFISPYGTPAEPVYEGF